VEHAEEQAKATASSVQFVLKFFVSLKEME